MTYLILENAKFGDGKELERAPFMLKVDFAINMRLVPDHIRPLLARLNRIRNKLVHDYFAKITKKDVAGLPTMVKPDAWDMFARFGDSPTGQVRRGIIWAYGTLSVAVTAHRDEVVRRKASQPIIEETMRALKEIEPTLAPLPKGFTDPEEIVRTEREKRKKAGDY
ncbi:MAG: hypothetical protein KGJ66_06535 [Alphaproteobacteria bacterium]|nr:hypothetical protein [Alphaproteobacteria bacterium]